MSWFGLILFFTHLSIALDLNSIVLNYLIFCLAANALPLQTHVLHIYTLNFLFSFFISFCSNSRSMCTLVSPFILRFLAISLENSSIFCSTGFYFSWGKYKLSKWTNTLKKKTTISKQYFESTAKLAKNLIHAMSACKSSKGVWKLYYNHGHNIVRLFDTLPNFLFTISETKRDY